MVKQVLRRGAAVVAAYVGVFSVLVVAQFTRSTGFFDSVGGVSVKGFHSDAPDAEPGSIDSITLSVPGLAFRFSPDRPLRYVDNSGTHKTALPRSYEKEEGSIAISFENGVHLVVESDSSSIALRLRGAKSATLQAAGEVSLDEEGVPVLVGPDGSRWEARWSDLDAGKGTIAIASGRPFPLDRIPAPTETATTASTVTTQTPMDPADFDAAIERFINKAWNGWHVTRWLSARLEWVDAQGSAFTDDAAAAYLAEAFRRGSGDAALERLKGARTTHASRLTWLTAPYFGNLMQKMRMMEQADLAEVKRITEAVRSQDPSIFAKEGLVSFLLDRAPYSIAQEATAFAGKIVPSRLDVPSLVGYVGSMADSRDFLPDESNPFLANESAAERLLASIRKTPDGFFLDRGDGYCDVRLSVLAGWNLMRWGRSSSRDVFVGVGQSLVVSALGLALDDGALPARFDLREGSTSRGEGRLDAEFVYPIVARNEYYPREVSFYKVAGPGAWAWTCVPGLSLAQSSTAITVTARYPVGKSHFLTVYGIKPYKQIRIYDIPYPGDPKFEMYDASGYQYAPKTGVIYLKMKHKKEIENVTMVY